MIDEMMGRINVQKEIYYAQYYNLLLDVVMHRWDEPERNTPLMWEINSHMW